MIEKIYKNQYMLTCDNCGEGQEFGNWAEVMEYMAENGWRKRMAYDDNGQFCWEHYCPECQSIKRSVLECQDVNIQDVNI